MLKLMIKSQKSGVSTLYKAIHTDALEHLIAIAKLYNEIKENQPNFEDEEIAKLVKNFAEGMKEDEKNG